MEPQPSKPQPFHFNPSSSIPPSRNLEFMEEEEEDTQIMNYNPWHRDAVQLSPPKYLYTRKLHYFGKFDECIDKNLGLDATTKSAALIASSFVVSLSSYSGIKRLFKCSGIIIDSSSTANGDFVSNILTSASLLRSPAHQSELADNIKVDVYLADRTLYEGKVVAYDFHYNVAEITISSRTLLESAIIGNVDNNPTKFALDDIASSSFRSSHHRDTSVELSPDMPVIALGRYYDHPYHIMAAPGAVRLVDSGLDCEDLIMTDCEITKNGIGGPIISCSGYVVGIGFYEASHTPFLPINIALKCLEHLQESRKVARPWLGAKLSDLHIAGLDELEKLNQTFPNLLEGVVVRQMESESPASRAGLCSGDVIVQLDQKPVRRTLEFKRLLLDKAKKPVTLIVKRAGTISPLRLTLRPQRTRKENRWPLPKKQTIPRLSTRTY